MAHDAGGVPVDPPHVAFVPFSGAAPARAVNWNDPTAQWNDFFTGFQHADGSRIGRVTGVAVGAQGSLFVADDQNGVVYRIRPASSATQLATSARSRANDEDHGLRIVSLTIALACACVATAASGTPPARAAEAPPASRCPPDSPPSASRRFARARELAVAPNGDLFVGTNGDAIYVVPDAQGTAGAPRAFATFDDSPMAGVFLAGDTLYAGGQFGVYRMPYRSGDREAREKPQKIASVRPGGGTRPFHDDGRRKQGHACTPASARRATRATRPIPRARRFRR